jgi:hypothetical protein
MNINIHQAIYNELKNESLRLGYNKITFEVRKTAGPFFYCKGFKLVRKNVNIVREVEIVNYHMSQ